ncbi:invasion associated locus B family protein [Bradyrhizobium lablabi]|uniref:invasion associated locus B family protein n=1 Tax=Bradyrhizobium lablabi TaxID=722472 RepID=UPI001BA4E539|nr:invasion associated locus B family protein [Bradyrhizobium lablabi]MBR1121774.1 invasion associated locus B family protein [Bradyrhizobium lablabi]
MTGAAQAQQPPAPAPKAKAPVAAPKAAQAPAPPPAPAAPPAQAEAAPATQTGWIARCGSASRDAPLECMMEASAVLAKTGQAVVVVNVRIAPDTRAPIALIQLPLGLNLPAGAKAQVDDGKAVDLVIQTCEQRGCYANAPITPDLLTALRSGKQLKLSFQNLAKETLTIPMPLTDFAAAYDKIK